MDSDRMLIMANWKMHLNTHESSTLVHRLHGHIKVHRTVEVVLAPSLLTLQPISLEIDRHKFRLATQNAYQKDDGPYTGEVSFTMLRELVHYAIIGHSERRIYFNETLEDVRDKVQAAVRNGIAPVLCVGETNKERAAGETRRVVHDQVVTALANLTSEDMADVVIAYEPVWAISTFGGGVADPADIKKMFDFIRTDIKALFGERVADDLRILYGGSVNAENAAVYLSIEGCNGALVGAASIKYHEFSSIIETAYRLQQARV
jgi:triosephosphate isomerase